MSEILKSLFADVKEIYPSILKHKIPSSIIEDIEKYVKRTDEIRKHKLNFLLEHYNIGNNSYQVSIPYDCLEGSFLQAYLIYLGEWYRCKYEHLSFNDTRRTVRLRRNENHFDAYDCWINYIEKDAINEWHNHAGNLSGVIYHTDCKNSATHFENGFSYKGNPGDILIFPSSLRHSVNKHTNKEKRITLAYNLYYLICSS
jgi:hypothetical protein|tara:strand:- start:2716 stop:3315 length:600 start_codon:yes stop_codon:yes gene_type:complete